MIKARTIWRLPRLLTRLSDFRTRLCFLLPVAVSCCVGLDVPVTRAAVPPKHSSSSSQVPGKPDSAVKATRNRKTPDPLAPWFKALARKRHRRVDVGRMLEFYNSYNPEALRLVRREYRRNARRAEEVARRLMEHFQDIDAVRRENPDEYRRLVNIEKMEARALVLGSQVRRLKQAWATAADRRQINEQIERRERELRTVLDKIFVARQENQRIALNRLEAELRELRELIEQRAANKKEIISNRFRTLTGTAPGLSLLRPAVDGKGKAKVNWDW